MKRFFLVFFLFISSVSYAQNNFLIAENYFRQGEYKKASQLYETLLKKNPFNSTYLKRFVTCLQETDDYKKAHAVLEKTLKTNPSQKYLYVEIGYNYERQQKTDLAINEYQKALEAIDTNPSLGGIIASMFRRNNLLDYALDAYAKTLVLNPNANYQFQIAQIYGEKGAFEKMFDSYIKLIDKNESYIGTVQRFISKYITENASDKNNIALKKSLLRKSISNPKNVWNELLSWLFTKQKEYAKAFIQEKALFKRNPEYLDNIKTLGKIAFDDTDYNAAKNAFSFLLKNTNFIDEKLNAELYLLKIEIGLKEKNIVSRFEKTLAKYGVNKTTIPVQITYAEFLTFTKNEPEKAQYILENALNFSKSKFQKARIKLKLGEVLVFTERFNKALIYFSQVQTQLKNHPLSQEARYKVAQTSYYKGDFKWAKAQLKILKGSTTQLIANDAVDLFLLISNNGPRDSIPSGLKDFAKADLLAYQNRNIEAIAIYSSLLKNFQGQEIEDETLFYQAKIFVKESQYENAVTNLIKLVDIDEEGVLVDDAYYLLAEIYRKHIKNLEKASEYYQKIIFEKASSIYLVDARKKFRELRGDTVN
ncbi:MAG: tetratricopeptide repeat protein [Flavobacteriaceae bacterium]|nr:tetratricopeptide repeat protein [Flavobacteriaceae bacterium]